MEALASNGEESDISVSMRGDGPHPLILEIQGDLFLNRAEHLICIAFCNTKFEVHVYQPHR